MSCFGRQGVRCDGCGVISSGRDGYAVIDGRGGHISSQGRNCEHDFCDRCEAEHAPAFTCRRCGEVPDGVRPVPAPPHHQREGVRRCRRPR